MFFGFGRPLDHPVPLFSGNVLVSAWRGVVDVVADALGVTFDEVDLVHEVAPTEERLETAAGVISRCGNHRWDSFPGARPRRR